MSKKPETRLSEKVLDTLKSQGGWWFKVHGGPYQLAGVPDIIGCWNGYFVAIELKIPGEKPTRLQELIIQAIHNAGGRTGIATSVEEALIIRDRNIILYQNRG